MSDARAKAEARRAKILARERKVSVSTAEDDAVADVAPLTSGEKVERPLAARRQKIQEAAEKTAEDVVGGNVEETSTEPQEKEDESFPIASETAPSSSSKKKTVQEIEAEIKQRTAEFDAKVLKEGIHKESNKESKKVKKLKNSTDNGITAAAVIKLFRASIIIALGILTGIRSIPSDPMIRSLLMAKYSSVPKDTKISEDSAHLDGEDFVAYQTLTNPAVKTGAEHVIRKIEGEKTWQQWFHKRLRKQVTFTSSLLFQINWFRWRHLFQPYR